MIKQFLDYFRQPNTTVLAQRELEDAQRSLLIAHSNAEFASSLVNYHHHRIARLSKYLKEPA